MSKHFLIDCTLRDGGNLNNWHFTSRDINKIFSYLDSGGVSFIEVGYRGGSGSNKSDFVGPLASCSLNFLNRLPKLTAANLAVMVVPSVCSEEDLESLPYSPVKMVRVASYPHNFDKALPYIRILKDKGLIVSMNLMSVSYASAKEVASMAVRAESFGADLFYIADSFGSSNPQQIAEYISTLKQSVTCRIGYHGHNNLGLAFANALAALNEGADYIDASLCGMARGAGNLPTEQFVAGLTSWSNYGFEFKLESVLEGANYVLREVLKEPMIVGTPEILCGLYDIHYYYFELIEQRCVERGLDIGLVCKILGEMRPTRVEMQFVDEACRRATILKN